jgi:hypothetical protein
MWPYEYWYVLKDDKYFEAQKELGILESRLKNLNDKLRMINNIRNPINNPNLPIPVPQDQGYEIQNGLLGVKRDLFNKLAGHRLADDRDLKERYEISRGVLPWKDHFGFKLRRLRAPLPDLNPELLGHYRKK